MKRLLILISLVVLSNVVISQKFTWMPDSTLTPKFNAIFQETFYHLLDSFRLSRGLHTLVVDSALEQIALKRSMYMDHDDILTHDITNTTNPYYLGDLLNLLGGTVENISGTSKCIPSPECMAIITFKGWLSSPGHRANMLTTGVNVGVAIYDNYATVIFQVY